MTLTIYELCGADDRRFSPYCWRTRLALAHKGLVPNVEPVGFTQKDKITF
ncbi:MAG: glutathione S-transferase family protein, partial [Proteobacteria bacterium]|nr:glutathione S-transferase family protein [Pseudomonadota bacterium]